MKLKDLDGQTFGQLTVIRNGGGFVAVPVARKL